MESSWTDHALLRAQFIFSSDRQGPGLWRANPRLATNPYFTNLLFPAIDDFFTAVELTESVDLAASIESTSPQANWDALKSLVQDIAKRVSRDQSSALERQCKRLQRKRNRICRMYPDPRIRTPFLKTVEKQIGIIQRELAENLRIRAGHNWREKGETSAGFLKRTIAARAVRKSIASLIHPTTNNLCTNPLTMQSAASAFYSDLYSPTPVMPDSVTTLCNTIPSSDTIPDTEHEALLRPFTIADLLSGTYRTKLISSPGVDGLPYAIINILLQHPKAAKLAVTVFNQALTSGIFPPSWLQTCMCLLPKSGDLSNLKNWRPLSLICCDAKIFTRLLNLRLMPLMNKLICPQQSGFMPGRFIGENGMMLHNTKLIATQQSSESIALLLDQEKAYDRVHPEYLRAVMSQFNIPTNITHSLLTLLFSTQIHININGHISHSFITQQRGIRQGDPISPLLFNIAFDPFLRSIQQDANFRGFDFATEAPLPSITPTLTPSISVKILAYADDTLVYLQNFHDFNLLQQAVERYMQASNALLNYHKTIATSLSGRPSTAWQSLLTSHGITAWHDRTSSTPLIYLGYPICSSHTQRNFAYQQLYNTINTATQIHSQRHLSIRGRVTVLNSLIYSRLWHVMRLTTFTKAQLLSLRSLGTTFVNQRTFPRFSFDTLSRPRSAGGVGLLDPLAQQQALQWHWVCPILLHSMNSPLLSLYTVPSLPILLYTLSWFYYSPNFSHFLYYMLFPSTRRRFWFPSRPLNNYTFLNPFANFEACLSNFSSSIFDTCYVDAVTCLSLPLYEVLLQTLPPTHPSFHTFIPADLVLQSYPSARQLLVSDVFLFDTESQVLRVRSSFRHVSRHPTISKSVALLIRSHQIRFKPFFLQQCELAPRPTLSTDASPSLKPFCLRIIAPPHLARSSGSSSTSRQHGRLPLNSIRYFKKITTVDPAPLTSALTLRPHQWRLLWSTSIPLTARTVWFRSIHRKLPTKSILHHFIPQDHPSPHCTVCSTSTVEDHTHFLFSCPLKLLVWREMYNSFISSAPITDTNLVQHLNDLLQCKSISVDRDASLPFPDLSLPQLFACTLVAIWQAHWRWIFDTTPFLLIPVRHCLTRFLTQLDAELHLAS